MTAIATASVINDQESERDTRIDHSPSRFTAVNGRDSLVPVSAVGGGSSNGEKREHSEAWQRTEYDPTASHEDTSKENGSAGKDINEHETQRSTSHGSLVSINRSKRKRSESDEQADGSLAPYRGPRSPVQPTDNIAEQSSQLGAMSSQSDTESKRTSLQAHARQDEEGNTRRSSTNASWHEYDLAEALQRDAQGPDVASKNWDGINRPTEGPMPREQARAPSLSQDRPQNAVQVAPRRKRVFSNRTKTGCLTCRRRKKKCDEQHPNCNNCTRGGFICEGYSTRSTFKPSTAKAPIPLQSKEGHPDISGQYVHDINQHDRPQNLMEPVEPTKLRPIVDDDNRPTAQFNTSPSGVGSNRGSWSKRTWPSASHPSYTTDHLGKSDYREVPSIHELSREGHPKNDYQLVPPIREIPHGGHTKHLPLFPSGIDQRPVHTNGVDTSTPQAQARMALSIEHQLSSRAVSSEETEKDKMLRGELYRPFDVLLVEERERCKAALWRFNNSCNPVSGLSAREQSRLLKEVLVPQASNNSHSNITSPRPAGSIGQGVVVEAPFKCSYGYNIHLGEDVLVSEDCSFVDDCPITIGAHTYIGQRVLILTSMAHANMQERKGSQSRYQGRPVTIEEDCWIGAGCIIFPGVRVRRGAVVGAGEIVKSDIVGYGFQGMKPSYM
ncbi:uncharacterized protein BDV17DRAFT_46708 [Aspergillus undulatus]|uniref:uncharacterized protein n=1 Tax=Aspergillus undulatus TaxID=1810928 RepID=UPI003CCCF4AD